MTYPITKTESEWKALLAEKNAEPLAYHVTRKEGTERAFSGKYESCKATGTYHCICCDQALFASTTKFDAGCGWPSYYQPIAPEAVALREDFSHGMHRIEVRCSQCGAHLGHVFPDGPAPTGERYCINSVSLKLAPEKGSTEKS